MGSVAVALGTALLANGHSFPHTFSRVIDVLIFGIQSV